MHRKPPQKFRTFANQLITQRQFPSHPRTRATGIPAQAKKFPERLPPADGGARPRLRGRQRRGRREGPTLTDAEQCQALTEGREGKLIAARGEQELVELPGRTTRGTEARGKEGSARRERERSQRGSEGGRERGKERRKRHCE